ncbi:MAG: hypothetical protein P4L41_17605 [Flavipsychrobacter sp.]|nr:hypothetical protein [Flavipsychrobacter sp.]
MIKKIFTAILALAIIGGCIAYYQWHKPHQKAEDAQGIVITAVELAKQYKADEKAADLKYLSKVIEVSGTINEVDKNQDGGSMLILETGDPMAGVQCSIRDKNKTAAKGQNVVIKGFCSGSGITGIALTDCIIK